MKKHNLLSPFITTAILSICFFLYFILSWIIVFRDPRALIGIGNLYPVIQPYVFPIQTFLTEHGLNSIPTIIFAAVSLIAVIFYLRSLQQKISLQTTINSVIVFGIVAFFSFPILSTDIFSYIMSERVSTVHQENIWQVKPEAFPDDQFSVLADWKETTSVYGALHYFLYLIPSMIGQDSLLTLVVLYKLIPAIFAFGSMWIVFKLLQQFHFQEPEIILRLIFWNPLVVLELFSSGHNDSMMLFFALLGFYLFRKKLWLLSGIVFAAAVQIKLIPIVLFSFCLLQLLLNKKFKNLFLVATSFVAVNFVFFLLMQVNVFDFLKRVAYNGGVYWQSLPNIIQTFSPDYTAYVSIAFLVWLVLFIVLQFKKAGNPVYSYTSVILVYLLFVSAAYWNWYVLWVLPFVVFTQDKRLIMTTIVLSITSLFAYPLLWVIHRINTPSDYWPIVQYGFIFVPPILIYAFSLVQKARFDQFVKRCNLDKLIADKTANSV